MPTRIRRRAAAGQQYALIVGLVAVVAIAAITSVGGNVRLLMGNVSNRLMNLEGSSSGGGGGSGPGTVYTFTTCGATGRNGPTSCPYTSTNLAGAVSVSDGYQLWTVPATGIYRIEAYGAAGQPSIVSSGAYGLGAHAKGDIALTAGQSLLILVGQQGTRRNDTGGGGGGSFVTRGNNRATSVLLIAAGGGGGYGSSMGNNTGAFQHGQATNDGANGYRGYGQGQGGGGGNGGSGSGWGGAGGGLTGNGSGDGIYGSGGVSFRNGGTGGASGSCSNNCSTVQSSPGGFGGGASAGSAGGAAGGGYSGGGASGGGGGSFASGADNDMVAGVREGEGQVVITFNP